MRRPGLSLATSALGGGCESWPHQHSEKLTATMFRRPWQLSEPLAKAALWRPLPAHPSVIVQSEQQNIVMEATFSCYHKRHGMDFITWCLTLEITIAHKLI